MKYIKRDDGIYELHISQEEIDRAARMIYRFRKIEAGLKETNKTLNDLEEELLQYTQGFLQ